MLTWCLGIKHQLPQGQVLAWHFWRTGGLALRWYLLLFIQSSTINAGGVLTPQLQSRPSLFFFQSKNYCCKCICEDVIHSCT